MYIAVLMLRAPTSPPQKESSECALEQATFRRNCSMWHSLCNPVGVTLLFSLLDLICCLVWCSEKRYWLGGPKVQLVFRLVLDASRSRHLGRLSGRWSQEIQVFALFLVRPRSSQVVQGGPWSSKVVPGRPRPSQVVQGRHRSIQLVPGRLRSLWIGQLLQVQPIASLCSSVVSASTAWRAVAC